MSPIRHYAAAQQEGRGAQKIWRSANLAGRRPRSGFGGRRPRPALERPLLDVRGEPRGAAAGARFRRRDQALLQEPAQSARAHHLRQDPGGRRRVVRALDPALRQARLGHRVRPDRRRARAHQHRDRVGTAVLPAAAFRAHVLSHAAPAAAEAADRCADVGPLRHAAARHRRGLPAQSRCLHHRLGRCAHGAAVGGPLRSRRLHRLRHRHAALPRRRHPCRRGVPAVGAGAGGDRADGGRQRSLCAALDHADGRPDRHPQQSDRREQAGARSAASTGSAATSSPRCRSRIRASCAMSIRASCSSRASSA